MYLSKKTYVKNWSFQKPEEQHEITVKKGGEVRKDINPDKISNIEEEAGYWRKANAIHNWFVENVQDGVDECQTSYVDTEKLKELLEICKKVKASLENSPKRTIQVKNGWDGEKDTFIDVEIFEDIGVAEELLPTQGGFFFGSTEYDEGYLQDINDTINIIEEALLTEDADFYYHASW